MNAHVSRLRLGVGRWATKKLARGSVAIGSRLVNSLVSRVSSKPLPCVRVLTYHRFGPSRRDPFCVSSEAFNQHMQWLASRRLAVSLDQVIAYLERRETLLPGSVLVTIDDGYRSTLTEALPVLQKYQVPAIAFLTSDRVDRRPTGDSQVESGVEEPILTWEEVRTLRAGGVEIGSHSLTHRSLARMPGAQAREEALGSLRRIEEKTGSAVRAFAYPFGTRADYSAKTAAYLREAGYRCAFTSQHGSVTTGADIFELPRVKVEGGEGFWMFRLLVRGGLDAWQFVDRTLWRWQQSPGS